MAVDVVYGKTSVSSKEGSQRTTLRVPGNVENHPKKNLERLCLKNRRFWDTLCPSSDTFFLLGISCPKTVLETLCPEMVGSHELWEHSRRIDDAIHPCWPPPDGKGCRMKIGYGRVSKLDQNPDLQVSALTAA